MLCFISDTTVSSYETCTEQAADRSGWLKFGVLVVKRTLLSVDIMDGEDTTVITLGTSQYRVLFTQYQTVTQVEVTNSVF